MTTLTAPAAFAFQRLKAQEFEPVIGYLDSVYQDALEDMSKVNDAEQWRKLQGRAQLAKELLGIVKSSSDLVAKLSRPQQ